MVVIDASVANKLFFPHEEGYIRVRDIIENHLSGKEIITVPNLLLYEVTNALATKTIVPKSKIGDALNELDHYGLEVFYPTVENMISAGNFSKDSHVSVYDAIYVIVAQENKCDLITADNKFAKQVNLPFVKTLGSLS
ncbi:MAG: type II toxin-antitoxin system VapC family toxin [Candidatus Magasanikbacteria bacterium]|nr:type II toxin-antitoxin system VapC family toxin [Candidatus Magasanikbacteria bacterium]